MRGDFGPDLKFPSIVQTCTALWSDVEGFHTKEIHQARSIRAKGLEELWRAEVQKGIRTNARR
jgi:hypothetical protein